MKAFKTRHQFYLPEDLSAELERLSAKAGGSKTAILTDAFRVWLDRRAGPDIDKQFGHRLEKLGRGQERLSNRIDILVETLGTFILREMMLTAHQPPFDEETRSKGVERYRAFIDVVGRRLASPDTPRLTPRDEDGGA